MSNLIEGTDVLGQMKIDGIYYDIFCAKSVSLRFNQDEIEVTSVNSTRGREFVPGMYDFTMSCTGVSEIDNSEDRISILYLLQEAIRGQTHDLRIHLTNQDGDQKAITFSGFMRTSGFIGEAVGFSNCDVDFRITGVVDLGDPIDEPEPPACEMEDTIYIDCVEGEYSVHSDLLEQDGVVILGVARTGAVHYYTSGTPTSLQFTHDLPNGDIIFSSLLTFNAGEWVRVQYKIES